MALVQPTRSLGHLHEYLNMQLHEHKEQSSVACFALHPFTQFCNKSVCCLDIHVWLGFAASLHVSGKPLRWQLDAMCIAV